MKNDLVLCAAAFLVLMSVLFYAEFGVSTPTASASPSILSEELAAEKTEAAAADETEIRRILENYYEIARTGDRQALKDFSREIAAPEYLYSSELGVMDKQAAMRHFDALDMKFVAPAFENLTIQIHGADAAIAKYRDTSTVKINGVLLTRPTQFTNIWVKQDGAWKIAAEHSSRAAPAELLPRNRFADNLARK